MGDGYLSHPQVISKYLALGKKSAVVQHLERPVSVYAHAEKIVNNLITIQRLISVLVLTNLRKSL